MTNNQVKFKVVVHLDEYSEIKHFYIQSPKTKKWGSFSPRICKELADILKIELSKRLQQTTYSKTNFVLFDCLIDIQEFITLKLQKGMISLAKNEDFNIINNAERI